MQAADCPVGAFTSLKNERRKARLARIGKCSGAEFDHRDSWSRYREPAQAVAEDEPRCVVDFAFSSPHSSRVEINTPAQKRGNDGEIHDITYHNHNENIPCTL